MSDTTYYALCLGLAACGVGLITLGLYWILGGVMMGIPAGAMGAMFTGYATTSLLWGRSI